MLLAAGEQWNDVCWLVW